LVKKIVANFFSAMISETSVEKYDYLSWLQKYGISKMCGFYGATLYM